MESLKAALADRYKLEHELGRGGMATVYLAHDLRHSRPVAIKVIHPELAQALGTERFLREIRIAASLNHPHILPLLDSGAERGHTGATDGVLWYAMPFIEGESLRARLTREKQLPLADALRIARNVAAALAYAHSRGIIHRDIKPENILLAANEALVADFGIARAITAAGGDALTPSGLSVGTPAYMSPEQAAGERVLDGRTDLYGLGCVLYEMLAGEPPFTGPTAQAILAKRLSAPLPSLHLVRDTIPLELDATIARALARVPADRFATAMEFADALAAGPRTVEHPRREGDRRWWIVPAALALVTLILGTVLVRSRAHSPPKLDPDLVAIAPFDALVPSLQAWSEGLVDVLSRSLDGAGPLRTVPPTVALRGWSGRADRASAAALGRRTGAGLVLFGALERRGSDSVGVRAALLEVGARDAPLEVEVRGDTLGLANLVDSLAVALLRELARTRPVGAVRQSPLGSRSLPALKAFLRGEQYYRRSLWDSALVQYDRALALDSTFALAYRRMSWVLGWNSAASASYGSGDEYLRRAVTLNQGLAPRDSLLFVIDSLGQLGLDILSATYFDSRRRLSATLADAQRLYPGDPEVWYSVGEARYHFQGPDEAAEVERLDAFDRAIALDSAFAPAYFHTPGLAIAIDRGDPKRAQHYLAAYLRLNPRDDNSAPLRLTAMLLDPSLEGSSETARLIATTPARVLWSAGVEYLTHWPDSAETAVRVLRSLVFGRHSSAGPPSAAWSDSSTRRQALASALTFRGHLREAYHIHPKFAAGYPGRFLNPYVRLVLLGAVPAETATAVFQQSLERDVPTATPGLVTVLPWWFSRRDTAALARFASLCDSVALHDSVPLFKAVRHYGAQAARGYAILARGDSTAALRAFASLPDSVCAAMDGCRFEKLIQARLLGAIGEYGRSFELLEEWTGLDPEVVLERARLAERLGKREQAMQAYQFVADAWRHADQELQPYVREARSRLARLLAE